MTSEQRLDRLERIARLFVRATLRARRNMKEQGEKIDIIINHQIAHDERIDRLNESIERTSSELSQSIGQSHSELSQSIVQSHSELSQSIVQSHSGLSQSIVQSHSGLSQSIEQSHSGLSQSIEQSHSELSQSLNELAKAQTETSQRLDSLIEIVRHDRNGNSN